MTLVLRIRLILLFLLPFFKKKHKNWASPSGRGPFRSIIITPILQVAEALIKKVLAPPTQKTKLIEAKEVCLDNRHA